MFDALQQHSKLVDFRAKLKDSTRVSENNRSAFTFIERYSKLAQSLTIIVGVFTGVISIFNAQLDRRVARTIDFEKQYHLETRKDYLRLITNWNTYADHLDIYSLKEPEQVTIVLAFFNSDEHRQIFDEILDFYDSLYTCIDKKSCDKNSALDIFGKNAFALYGNFAYYINHRRQLERDRSIGFGLAEIFRMRRESFFMAYW